MSRLIEAIPDELALRCLACIPLNDYPNLELVSRSWQAVIRSDRLFKLRKEIKSSENLLCVCASIPQNIWHVYSPTCDRWLTLPSLPSNIHYLESFGAVTIGRKLFVLGGCGFTFDSFLGEDNCIFATSDVWSYDFVEKRWDKRASMLVPRAKFACCVLDGKIIVAGGFTSVLTGFGIGRKSISRSEIYNPNNNKWTTLPELDHTHNSACSGLVLKGKVHVFHKGLPTVQVLESVEHGWVVKDYSWPQGPMVVIEDEPYVMSEKVVFKQEGETWKKVASVPESESRINLAMTSLSKEVLIFEGGTETNYLYIEPLSDVDALTVGNDQPMWRKLTPMTRFRGTILACTQLTI